MSRWLILIQILIVGGSLAGCAALGNKQGAMLDLTLLEYEKLIRWGYFQKAARYLVSKDKDAEPQNIDFDGLEQIRVSSYNVTHTGVSDDHNEALVLAVIEFYNRETAQIKRIKDPQHWWYNDTQRRWVLNGTLPEFIPQPEKDKRYVKFSREDGEGEKHHRQDNA